MFRVISTIHFDEKTAGLVPGSGPGLLVYLDLAQRSPPPIMLGTTVRVHRPDGTSFYKVVRAIEVWGPSVGLFFRDIEQHEIPVSSEIELVGT